MSRLTLLGAGAVTSGGGGGTVGFDPINKGTDITVSGAGNVIATLTTVGPNYEAARSINSVSADGTYLVDFLVGGDPSSYLIGLGYVNVSAGLNVGIDATSNGAGVFFDGTLSGGITGASGPTYTTGDTVRMQVVISGGGATRTVQFKNVTTGGSFLPVAPAVITTTGALFFAMSERTNAPITVSNTTWT